MDAQERFEDAIREYGLACRIAGKDAWLTRLAESGGTVDSKLEAALVSDRRAEDRVGNAHRALLAEREEMLAEVERLRAETLCVRDPGQDPPTWVEVSVRADSSPEQRHRTAEWIRKANRDREEMLTVLREVDRALVLWARHARHPDEVHERARLRERLAALLR